MATTTIKITLDTAPGEQTVFEIEFNKVDFMAVVDEVEFVTVANVHNNKLFKVV